MRPRFKEDVAGHSLVLPTINPVPYGFCDALGHLGAEEGVVDVHVEVERERGVFRHGVKGQR